MNVFFPLCQESKVAALQRYLELELRLLEADGVGYAISYLFLETMLARIRTYLRHNAAPISENVQLPEDSRERVERERRAYLQTAQTWLTQHAGRYQPDDGSFYEDLKKRLMEMTAWIETLKEGTETLEHDLEAHSEPHTPGW